MLTVRCATFDFNFCPFVLSILPYGGAIGTIDSGGVIEIFNFSSVGLMPLVTSSYSLCGPHSPALGQLKKASFDPCSCSYFTSCLLFRWKILSCKVIFPKVSCMTPFRQFMMALDVAKNGLPSIMGTWLVPSATGSVSRTMKSTG